jgi:hypothetical protein
MGGDDSVSVASLFFLSVVSLTLICVCRTQTTRLERHGNRLVVSVLPLVDLGMSVWEEGCWILRLVGRRRI